MTADQATALVRAVADLLTVLVWPAVVVFVLLKFRAPIASFLKDLGEFTFKAPGLEASARRRQAEAAANLGAAEAARAQGAAPSSAPTPAPEVGRLVESLPGLRQQRQLAESRVLWVDDRPGNNEYERRAFEALGVRVDISTTTDDALARLLERHYDLVISDMSRPPDDRAGFTLLDQLRQRKDSTPYVIYAGSRDPEHVREARQRGALGCTNSPQELMEYVIKGLGL